MAKYKIVGPRRVAGADPGETVELDLPEANIAALVKAGHISPVKPSTPKKLQTGGLITADDAAKFTISEGHF